jgi:hypothetical protein
VHAEASLSQSINQSFFYLLQPDSVRQRKSVAIGVKHSTAHTLLSCMMMAVNKVCRREFFSARQNEGTRARCIVQ